MKMGYTSQWLAIHDGAGDAGGVIGSLYYEDGTYEPVARNT